MCESAVVLIHGEERWCDNIGELAKAMNMRPARIPVNDDGPAPAWNHCLCHVNFRALAANAGMTCTKRPWDDYYIGEWELRASS